MIPNELIQLPQWVLWREVILDSGKRTKVPYQVRGGAKASSVDPATWSTYSDAVDACKRQLANGIGFVLSKNDPYGFIDLDDPYKNVSFDEGQIIAARHCKIMQEFSTYTEMSPSSQGMHLIVKTIPMPTGRRRANVELYTSERFMTMTGNTYYDLPIENRSWLVQQLWNELGDNRNGDGSYAEEKEEKYPDDQIWTQAKEAQNGEKFLKLWNGNWMDAGYQSQSEADFALIDILSFYSRNVNQIQRLFFASGLGRRDKAKRKNYVFNMIKRSFDNQPLYLPLTELTASIKEQLEQTKVIKKTEIVVNPFAGPLFQNIENPDQQYDWTVPPGLLGEIAQYIYSASPRPVKEIALAGAIGFMAGVCGRQYNISGTGLNQYILMLAGTGTGKEAMRSGIDRIMRRVRNDVPAAMEYLGPNDIASGQAVIKYIARHPCFVSVVGEFGLLVQQMCAFNAGQALVSLRKKLLELYNKSGEKDVMQPTIYSDKEKNTQVVHSPALTILGESTPETYYGGIDDLMISQGLLPRFLCIEYLGKRPPFNENHNKVEPNDALISSICELTTNCLTMANNSRVIHVELNEEAKKFSDEFEKETTSNINNSELTVAKELWNRAHLKVLKLSGLIAIGVNMYQPLVTLECIQWAHGLVERDIRNVFDKFEKGKVGRSTSEASQSADMTEIIKDYIHRPWDVIMQRYKVDSRMHQDRVITFNYFLQRLNQRSSFKHDRMGATFAIKRTIDNMVSDGALQEIRQIDLRSRYSKLSKAYIVTDITRFVG